MTTAQIAAIDQTNMRDSAYQALHDAFTRGAFAPGDVLSLRSLAEQLGTSMTPVREAVRRLVAEGALIDTRSRKLLVPPFDPRRMSDLKSARLALESLLLEQALASIDASGIAKLKAILERPEDPAQHGPDLVQNYDFHFTLYRMSGSDVLLPIVEALWLQYGSYLNLIIYHKNVAHIEEHKYHGALLNALERNDLAAAQVALRRDIEQSFGVLKNDPDLASMAPRS
ncbi:HTH-type transcriptional regulator McbR [Roseobacter fucihabitans]|uniref:HTH-type transcriptional regulator McbR n=1 Tax=Roseobacter fucihabitans TaxID=1537242 RepID=A0ABZ2BXQ0_9RHOB|nr:GntR family transcriptional regulator [Roseobacter litoralis]MBC6964940.1 HTH-type transcriptional regulator McbR [Roseobacter litoralis]